MTHALDWRRFDRAVPWLVKGRFEDGDEGEGAEVHVEARSLIKAFRAARRKRHGLIVEGVDCAATVRTRRGVQLDELGVGVDYRVPLGGKRWLVTRFEDGAVTVWRPGYGGALVSLARHIVVELHTVGAAVRYAAAMPDKAAVCGLAALALAAGLVLSSPAAFERVSVRHVTAGRHPDGGEGFACVTDPHAVVVEARQLVRTVASAGAPSYERDRSPFAAAMKFVELVGEPAALWAVRKAQEGASS